jgi:hypothetical protein
MVSNMLLFPARQAEDCLRLEQERVVNHLHASTKPKLLHKVDTYVTQHVYLCVIFCTG